MGLPGGGVSNHDRPIATESAPHRCRDSILPGAISFLSQVPEEDEGRIQDGIPIKPNLPMPACTACMDTSSAERVTSKTWRKKPFEYPARHGLYVMFPMNPWREAWGAMQRTRRMPSLVSKWIACVL